MTDEIATNYRVAGYADYAHCWPDPVSRRVLAQPEKRQYSDDDDDCADDVDDVVHEITLRVG